MFGRCTHEELRDMFMALQVDLILQNLPREKFPIISSDGPYISTALYWVLNECLKKSGHEGLLL